MKVGDILIDLGTNGLYLLVDELPGNALVSKFFRILVLHAGDGDDPNITDEAGDVEDVSFEWLDSCTDDYLV